MVRIRWRQGCADTQAGGAAAGEYAAKPTWTWHATRLLLAPKRSACRRVSRIEATLAARSRLSTWPRRYRLRS